MQCSMVRLNKDSLGNRRWLFATPPRSNALLWLFRCTNLFKFRVSIRVTVKLVCIRLGAVRSKVRLTRLISGVYTHLHVEG